MYWCGGVNITPCWVPSLGLHAAVNHGTSTCGCGHAQHLLLMYVLDVSSQVGSFFRNLHTPHQIQLEPETPLSPYLACRNLVSPSSTTLKACFTRAIPDNFNTCPPFLRATHQVMAKPKEGIHNTTLTQTLFMSLWHKNRQVFIVFFSHLVILWNKPPIRFLPFCAFWAISKGWKSVLHPSFTLLQRTNYLLIIYLPRKQEKLPLCLARHLPRLRSLY